MKKALYTAVGAFVLLLMSPLTVMAHHPMGGDMVGTFWESFISGIFHPILGPEHLVLIAVVGAFALSTGRIIMFPVLFVVGMVGGCLLTALFPAIAEMTIMALPTIEIGVFGSLFLLSLMFLVSGTYALLLVLLAGATHGIAYGEAIIGADSAMLLTYLGGLTVIQIGFYVAFLMMLRWLFVSPLKAATALGVVGLSVGGFGLYEMFSEVGISAVADLLS